MFSKKAFTILEVLLVILIISLILSVTYPVGIKLIKKFNAFLEKVEKDSAKKREEFRRFLRDE